MEANTIIVVGVILALLAMLSFLLMKVSSKEYPKEEIIRPKFEPRNITFSHCTDEAEKPKRKYKKRRKKKPTVANDAQVEKRPVGRPRKSE
jgi:sortase (surface protein transpeptidase)